MYGNTSSIKASGASSGTSQKNCFAVLQVSEKPTGLDEIGTIAVKSRIDITGFKIICKETVNGTSITANDIFNDALVGDVFWVINSTEWSSSNLIICDNPYMFLQIGPGTKVYQKISTGGNLSTVDAWIYARVSHSGTAKDWRAMNT